jgi:predicted small secreted protein
MKIDVVRTIAVIAAVAALCAAAAGCVSDPGAQAANQSTGQLRYYGGPKYPMWQSQ